MRTARDSREDSCDDSMQSRFQPHVHDALVIRFHYTMEDVMPLLWTSGHSLEAEDSIFSP